MKRHVCRATAVALLAATLRGASAQAAASRAPPPPTPLSASSFNADAINAATVQAAKAVLGGLTLRCGISNVKSDCPSPSERTANSTCLMTGSTFAGVDPLDTDTLQAVADAPWGTSVGPLPPASVVGLTAFVLQYAARHSGLNVEFYAARVPPVVQYNADSTQSYMYMMYDQGFDCAAFGVTFMYERAQFMRYSAPYLPYKFTVVAPRPTLAAVKYTDVMWTVFSAFSPSCWGVVIASVVISGVVHSFLDTEHKVAPIAATFAPSDASLEAPATPTPPAAHHEHEQETTKEEEEELIKEEEKEFEATTIGRIGLSIFESAVSISAHGFFSHHTTSAAICAPSGNKSAPDGSIADAWVKAVCYFLMLSLYTANLAAFFTLAPTVSQKIASVDDFMALNVPACIGNRSDHIQFFRTYYPSLQLQILPNWQGALDAVVAGTCLGAVGSNFDLLDGMSPQSDTNGNWCGLKLVGPLMGQLTYGLSFTANRTQLSDDVVNAVNLYIARSVESGDFQEYAEVMLGYDRPQCSLEDFLEFSESEVGWSPVTVQTLSGLAIVLGAGIVLAAALGAFELRILSACLWMQGVQLPTHGSAKGRTSTTPTGRTSPLSDKKG